MVKYLSPMKVAFVTFEYPPFVQGGAGVVAEKLTKGLARLGHKVHVIAPRIAGSEEHEINDGVFVHRINFINKPLLSAPSYWISLKKRFKSIEKEIGGFDIVHGNNVSDFSLTKKITKAPRVLTTHHLARSVLNTTRPTYFNRIKNLGGEIGIVPYIEKICINRADKIIAVSNYTKKELILVYNVPEAKIEVIYNGMEQKSFDFNEEEKKEIRDEFGIHKKPTVMFVGRFEERKGPSLLLQAFKQVLTNIDAHLVVVGSGDQKPYKQLAGSLGIMNGVIFTGYVDELSLRKLYSICDVYVSSSRLEGFGLTIVEAMAAGKPIVATKVGGIPEIVNSGENGILVEIDDLEGLANGICTYLRDKKLSKNVGKRNAKHIRERFSWEKSAKEMERVYRQLMLKK
ncbi:unnamed protein product, partial [marine sediment metagenome]